jgi:hypothetical protein
MKLTPANRKMLSFMSGPWGRLVRATVGSVLIAIALVGMGWNLLLLPLGIFMIATGISNYCPAGLVFPEWKKEPQILANFPTHKLK